MKNRKSRDQQKKALRESAPPNEAHLRPSKEAALVYKELPRKPADDKQIHPRRPLPPIPERTGDSSKAGQNIWSVRPNL
jgi:hypothetical protein